MTCYGLKYVGGTFETVGKTLEFHKADSDFLARAVINIVLDAALTSGITVTIKLLSEENQTNLLLLISGVGKSPEAWSYN